MTYQYGPLTIVFSAIVFFSSHAAASLFNHQEALAMACAISAQNLFTTCNQEDYGCFCDSSLFVYAVENCIGRESHYNSTEMGTALDKFKINFCELHHATANLTDVWSDENKKQNPTVSEKAYKLAYEGEKNYASQKEQSAWLGLGMIFFWVTVVGAVTAGRLVKMIIVRLFAHRMIMRRATAVERFLQRYIFWPAMFNSRHMTRFEYFRGYVSFSLPTRLEGILVSIYILMGIIFMLTPYTFMNNDPLYPSRWKEMMRYSSDRAGIIATFQLPMLILFALRNNILLWMTGWSYSTFNTYHRAIARVTYLLLVIHAVLKHIFSVSYGGSLVKYYYPVPYFRYGCAAIGLFSLMIAAAMVRSRGYEFFYRMHQLMAIGAIICSILHLDGLGFKEPLWICIALWGADWVIRVGRILIFNVNFILPPLPGSRKTTFATARVYPSQMVKLTITTPVYWICKPGQYVFLHTRRWTFIGGHPFSVLGASESGDGLELVLKAREGFTRRLHTGLDDRSCSPEYPVTIPVYVEGPYGHSAPVENYDEGLFFAGGIGITGVLGFVDRMVEANAKSSFAKTARLFWSVRSKSDIDPVAAQLAKLARNDCVRIRIFIRPRAEAVAPLPSSGFTSRSDGSEEYDLEKHQFDPRMVSVDVDSASSSPGRVSNVGVTFVDPVRPPGKATDRNSSQNANLDPEVEADGGTGQSRMSWIQRRSRRFTATSSLYSSNKRHTRNFSRDVHNFFELAKAGNPEEDEEGDYGKGKFLERHPRGTYTDEDSSSDVDVSSDHAADRTDQHPVEDDDFSYNRWKRSTRFVAAGFTDAFTDRRLSTLNPFDDDVYRIEEDSMIARAPFESSEKSAVDIAYSLIEPVGMDVAHLMEHHFKHSDGSICVVGCGPDRMMDTMCWSACEFLDLAKNGRVDYFEEAFRW